MQKVIVHLLSYCCLHNLVLCILTSEPYATHYVSVIIVQGDNISYHIDHS